MSQIPEQAAIYRAICRANPDEDGSLMRELHREGVGHIIEQAHQVLYARPSRRPKYVFGFSVSETQGSDK